MWTCQETWPNQLLLNNMDQTKQLAARQKMEYNSNRDKLFISEYGRHVQKMILFAKTIEDKEKQQFIMDNVVILMGQMQPNIRQTPEFVNKLWNHAFMIADFALSVEVPEGVVIVPLSERKPPAKLPYPVKNMRFRHYGSNVQKLIDKAGKQEDAEKKEIFSNAIGSYMKLAYKTWNQDHYANDEVIKDDLKSMSNGDLDLEDSFQLNFLSNSAPARQFQRKRPGTQHGHHKNRSKGGRPKRRR